MHAQVVENTSSRIMYSFSLTITEHGKYISVAKTRWVNDSQRAHTHMANYINGDNNLGAY